MSLKACQYSSVEAQFEYISSKSNGAKNAFITS